MKENTFFVFDSIDLLCYNLNEISLTWGGSYIISPNWLKCKKTTINRKTNDDKGFQCVVTAALKYQNMKNNPERISKIKDFIHQYNWKEIEFLWHK